MSKDNTNCPVISQNPEDVKAALLAGAHPTVEAKLGSQRLRAQLYAMRPTVLAAANRFADIGYDVHQTLGLCDALLLIVGEMGATQSEALELAKKATRDRDEALRALIMSKEAMITVARMSRISTRPFESVMSSQNADPIALGHALLVAIAAHAHELKHPALVERVRLDVNERVCALTNAMKAHVTHRAQRVSTTQEKRLAKGALLHALQEMSRIGRILFADDNATKRALSLSIIATNRAKKKGPVDVTVTPSNGDDVDEEITDEVSTPVEEEESEVEEVIDAVVN